MTRIVQPTLEQWAARFNYPDPENKIVLVIERSDGCADMLTNQPLSSLKANKYKVIGMFRGSRYFQAPRFREGDDRLRILQEIEKVELQIAELRRSL